MYKFYNYTYQNHTSFSWVPIIAIVISILSIICSLYFIYLSKRIEIINTKFQKFCISNLEEIFKSTDQKLANNVIMLDIFKKEATDLFVEVQLYITMLTKIYPKIDIREIIRNIEEYTDQLYKKSDLESIEIRSGYISLKLKIFSLLYDYALAKELSLFARIGLKKNLAK